MTTPNMHTDEAQPQARDALQVSDLQALAMLLRRPGQPQALFSAVEALTARVIGHRLFTIMAFDPVTFEVERAMVVLTAHIS